MILLRTLAEAAGEAGHKGGLPQLDTSVFVPQLVWLAVTFVALYLLMSRWVVPTIGSVVEARAKRIADDLAEAERLKSETQAALADYEKALSEARGRAHGIAQDAREKIKAETEAERRHIEADNADKAAKAEAKIMADKAAAMAEVDAIAGDTARSIVSTLTGLEPTGDRITRALAGVRGS